MEGERRIEEGRTRTGEQRRATAARAARDDMINWPHPGEQHKPEFPRWVERHWAERHWAERQDARKRRREIV